MPCTQAPVTGEQGSEPAKGAQETAQPNMGLKTLTGACEQARVTHWPAETRPPSIRTLAAATAVCHRSVPCDPTSRDGHGVILGDKAEPSQPSAASGCAALCRSPRCSGGRPFPRGQAAGPSHSIAPGAHEKADPSHVGQNHPLLKLSFFPKSVRKMQPNSGEDLQFLWPGTAVGRSWVRIWPPRASSASLQSGCVRTGKSSRQVLSSCYCQNCSHKARLPHNRR